MKSIKLYLVMFIVITLVACSQNIKEVTYNSETENMVDQTHELTPDEKELFESAIKFAKDNNIDLNGQSVSRIISDQKKRLEAERKLLEEERKREDERKKELQRQKDEEKQKLNNSIQITFDGKSVIPEDIDKWQFNDVIIFDFTLNNTTKQDVQGFKGTAIFNDIFGDPIKKINIRFDEGISANNKINWKGFFEVNPYIDEENKLRDTDFTNIQFKFDMDTVIFSDGTSINKYGQNTQDKETQTNDIQTNDIQTNDIQSKDTPINEQHEDTQVANSDNPFEWSSGVKKKFEDTMIARGYAFLSTNFIYKNGFVNEDNEGYYEVYIDNNDGSGEQYLVVVNVKTGWFHG